MVNVGVCVLRCLKEELASALFSISLSHQGPTRKPKAYGAGSHYLHLIKWPATDKHLALWAISNEGY